MFVLLLLLNNGSYAASERIRCRLHWSEEAFAEFLFCCWVYSVSYLFQLSGKTTRNNMTVIIGSNEIQYLLSLSTVRYNEKFVDKSYDLFQWISTEKCTEKMPLNILRSELAEPMT